jgi:hypothetical protein
MGVVEELAAAGFGSRVLSDRAQLAAFGSDALTAFHRDAEAVVLVGSVDEVVGEETWAAGCPEQTRAIFEHVALGEDSPSS